MNQYALATFVGDLPDADLKSYRCSEFRESVQAPGDFEKVKACGRSPRLGKMQDDLSREGTQLELEQDYGSFPQPQNEEEFKFSKEGRYQ